MIDQQQIQHFMVLDLLQQSRELVSGFQKAFAFLYHPIEKRIIAVKAENKVETFLEINEPLSRHINTLRKQSLSIEWVEEMEIPFKHFERHTDINEDSKSKENKSQRNVFDEFLYSILLIRIPSKWDGAHDLLYIYFKPDASNFGITKHGNKLSTEHKSIISSFIDRSYRALHKQKEFMNADADNLRKSIEILKEQLNGANSRNKSNIRFYKNQLLQYIIQLMEEEARKLGVILKFSNEATDFLKDFKGSIINISDSVKKSISMAYRVQNTLAGGILYIEDYYVRAHFVEHQSKSINPIIESIAENRSSKTVQLLNKLENAARKAQAEGKSLTSSNIGQSMTNPISAPAISDALKKHKKRIQNLCNEYPNEWTLIRNSFTPLRNVIGA